MLPLTDPATTETALRALEIMLGVFTGAVMAYLVVDFAIDEIQFRRNRKAN